MKTLSRFFVILTAAVALPAMALAAPAKDGDKKAGCGEGKGRRGPDKAAMLKKFDVNGDGKLDDAEREAMHKAMKAARYDRMVEHFEKLDANQDAEISLAEAKDTRLAKHFDEVDTDKNGNLSWDEFEAAAPKHHRGGHKGKGDKSHKSDKSNKASKNTK